MALRLPFSLGLALLIPAAALGQSAPDDVTDWTVTAPGPSGSTTTAEGSFSSPERIVFGERMRQHALDQICKSVELPIDFSKGVDGIGGGGFGFKRSIRTLPNAPDRLGLVDEQKIAVNLGHTFELGQAGPATFGITVTAALQGSALILRPLPTNNACKELKQLAKLTTFKTPLPMSGERLGKMEVGELWKMPMLLTIGHSEGAGMPASPYGAVALSFGVGQTGSAIMSVYRLSPEAMRFRFRVEHVRVHDRSGQIVATYPAALIFAPTAANVLAKAVDSEISRQLSRYLFATLGVFQTSSEGQQVMMEFTVDPRKPEDLDALSKALRGDLRALVEMAGRMVTLQATNAAAQKDFARLDRDNEDLFHKSGDPGLDLYNDKTHSFHLHLPFFVDYNRAKDTRDDQIRRLTDEGGQFDLYKEDKATSSGWLEVPLKGQLVKHNTLRSAQAFVYESKDGKVSAPQAVYIYQEGFLRRNMDDVREAALEASRLTSLAGVRGEQPNPRLAMPLDGLLPHSPPPPPQSDDRDHPPSVPSYHEGNMTFTLVMTEKAVASIAAAGAELLVKCYANTLDSEDRALLNTALASAKFQADGTMDYDRRQFRRAFNDDNNQPQTMELLAKTASKIVRDVDALRREPTPQAQAAALTRLLAGKGESGLQYQEILAVLIQVVDPLDITADLALHVNKGIKGTPDANAHLTLTQGRPQNLLLQGAGKAKQRFAKPSDLVD